jgi:hypothetical protein
MKEMINLSIITVYNDSSKLENELIKSLDQQNVEVERIFLDSDKYHFKSASEALNYGASQATKDYFIFAHQDIVFESKNEVQNIYNKLMSEDAIYGIAGKKIDQNALYSTIYQGEERVPVNKVSNISNQEEVYCLDECLMACSRSVYNQIKFDEVVCNGWDFYVCDFCFQAYLKGIKIYSIECNIWHTSLGHPKHSFYKTLKKLTVKYKNKLPVIRTCCIYVKNDFTALLVIVLKEIRNNLIAKFK